ncbi:MAG: hypothetical protein HZA50_08295 [Planctomycetes bacterium]|nr:hypothetical protein [Planctomycetota bacterium]
MKKNPYFCMIAIIVADACLFCGDIAQAGDADAGWPMRGQNVRRTGQAAVAGPRRGTKVWTYLAKDANNLNIEPAVTGKGVFFGGWGLIRADGADKTKWDKMDGRIYGLNPADGKELWPPFVPAPTQWAYRYDARATTAQDSPAGAGLHLNWFNGTIEGTPAVDPSTGDLYVGRGWSRGFCWKTPAKATTLRTTSATRPVRHRGNTSEASGGRPTHRASSGLIREGAGQCLRLISIHAMTPTGS